MRRCAEPDCDTILSIYNDGDWCSLHGGGARGHLPALRQATDEARRGGRPRKKTRLSEAERARRYRERKRWAS